ncbi:hypothetical protein ACFL5I_01630, partial [Planctomycetota bacterium]
VRIELGALQRVSLFARVSSHWLSWAGIAAAILVIVVFNMQFEQRHQQRINQLYGPTRVVMAQEPNAKTLAKELVAMLGNNGKFQWLERRFELQLAQAKPMIDLTNRYQIISGLLK